MDPMIPRQPLPETARLPLQSHGLRVYLLGDFRILNGDRSIDSSARRLRKAGHLIKLLALSPNHRLHREHLMDQLWPDRELASASNNLRYALHVARRVLAPEPSDAASFLQFDGPWLTLSPGTPVWTDVKAFEDMAEAALQQDSPGNYYAALALFSGDLLPGDNYEDWIIRRRQALHDTQLALYMKLALLAEGSGETAPAIAALTAAINAEPAFESAHTQLMRLYVATGQSQRAIRQYRELAAILRNEMEVEPSAESRKFYEQIVAPGNEPVPAWSTPDPVSVGLTQRRGNESTNLPASTSTFVGRKQEISEILNQLTERRLVTLVGTGGIGKTRLAMEVAGQALERFPDGVWFAELAPLMDAELVAGAVASAAGMVDRPGRSAADELIDGLRTARALLVIDNCEHLVAGCAHLTQRLLRECPYLSILATSREVLGVSGEMVWTVAPLGIPPVDNPVEIDQLRRFESVMLFAERARLSQPAFEIDEQNAGRVATICRQLSGMPLAIELAAARMRLLSLNQIVTRLEDSLQLLVDGNRTAPARQQTLRAAIDWSYTQLSAAEQRLFASLSVFAGGWTLEAAESVCDRSAGGVDDVLSLLSLLVDKSLVVVETGSGAARYSFLEPLRQYASRRLQESNEADAVHAQHAALYLALAEQAQPELSGPGEAEWLERLEYEHDNVRAALRWCQRSGHVETGMRLASALWLFWYARGHVAEGRRWLERLLVAPAGLAAPAVRSNALNAAGNLVSKQGAYSAAREHFEASLAIRRQLEDQRGIAASLNNLGFVNYQMGEYDRAAVMFEEALQVERSLGYGYGAAHALANLGMIAYQRADYETAHTRYHESLDLFTSLGSEQGAVVSLCYLGHVALAQEQIHLATSMYQESLARAQRVAARRAVAMSLAGLGRIHTQQQNYAGAHTALSGSLRVWQETENAHGIATCLEGFAELAAYEGRTEKSLVLAGTAERLREDIEVHPSPAVRVMNDRWLAMATRNLPADGQSDFRERGRKLTLEEAITIALVGLESGAQPPEPVTAPDGPALTPRERQVAMLITEGLINRQIAVRLGIGERTVNTHVHNILQKLTLVSRAQIAVWATRHYPAQPDSDGASR